MGFILVWDSGVPPGTVHARFRRPGSCLWILLAGNFSQDRGIKATWMGSNSELAVGLLDLKLRGGRRDAQGIIVSGVSNHGGEGAARGRS